MQTNFPQTPITIIRLAEVMKRTGLPKSSVYEQIKLKQLTTPVPIGLRRVGWPSFEIDEINRTLIGGADTKEIQNLVVKLIEQRQHILSGVKS